MKADSSTKSGLDNEGFQMVDKGSPAVYMGGHPVRKGGQGSSSKKVTVS